MLLVQYLIISLIPVATRVFQSNIATTLPFMSPRLSSPAHPGSGGATPGRGRGGGGGGGGGGPGVKRDREFIGQTVRIIQGPFKGECDQNFIFKINIKCKNNTLKTPLILS